MLFNSFGFLFLYLPTVLAGYFLIGRLGSAWATAWLALASLFFYGYWSIASLPLLMLSILFNYACGRLLASATTARRKWLLAGAVGVDLGVLGYYKYANFLIDSVNRSALAAWPAVDIVLPIGISFFTFTQIAFLVDCYRGHARAGGFFPYLLFVSYFPHLIAGPVLHHKDMMPQFSDRATCRPQAANLAIGVSLFVAGLAKKVLLADTLAPMVAPVFAVGAEPPLIEAWIGTLAYTCQLYFDFSGYCDMAIGISWLFGVRLPLNFNSPYQAHDISDFWRRWHMTLSRFLRDYLYVPLGGSRHGPLLRYRNLMLTMVLGGLWHGAGWTFIAWGGLHGGYLVLHQGWRQLDHVALQQRLRRARAWPWVARLLTFLAVMVAWVVFRAPDLAVAANVLGGLAGLNGISLPRALAAHAHWLTGMGVNAQFDGIGWIDFGGNGPAVLLAAMVLALAAPNSQHIFLRWAPGAHGSPGQAHAGRLAWAPTRPWSVALAVLFLACVFGMQSTSEFLYFQF